MKISFQKNFNKCSFNSLDLTLKQSAREEMLDTVTPLIIVFIFQTRGDINYCFCN